MSASSSKQLDMKKIRLLIKSGIQAIPADKYFSEAIILLGDTGVGKSTLINFLSGSEMTVKFDGLKVNLHCDSSMRAKIGHTKISQTFLPTKILVQRKAIFDCPGFNDNKGEEFQLANSFFLQRLFSIYSRIKIMIIVDESHISEPRADKFPKLLHNLLGFFNSFNDIVDGCCLVISRANRQNTKTDYQQAIIEMLQNQSNKKSLFNEQQEKLLRYLVENNRILLFYQPEKRKQDYKYQPSIEESQIMGIVTSFPSVRSKKINHCFSDNCKLSIIQLIDHITNSTKPKLQKALSNLNHQLAQSLLLNSKDIDELNKSKQELHRIRDTIANQDCQKILETLRQKFTEKEKREFEEQSASVEFFKDVYDRRSFYYESIKSLLVGQSNMIVNRIEEKLSEAIKKRSKEMEEEEQQIKKALSQQQKQTNSLQNQQRNFKQAMVSEIKDKKAQADQQYASRINRALQLSEQSQHKINQKEAQLQSKSLQQQKHLNENIQRKRQEQQKKIKAAEQTANRKKEELLIKIQQAQKRQKQDSMVTQQIIQKMKNRNQRIKQQNDIQHQYYRKEIKNNPQQKTINNGFKNEEIEAIKSFVNLSETQEIQMHTEAQSQVQATEKQQALSQYVSQYSLSLNKREIENTQSEKKDFDCLKAELIKQSSSIDSQLTQFIESIRKRRQKQLGLHVGIIQGNEQNKMLSCKQGQKNHRYYQKQKPQLSYRFPNTSSNKFAKTSRQKYLHGSSRYPIRSDSFSQSPIFSKQKKYDQRKSQLQSKVGLSSTITHGSIKKFNSFESDHKRQELFDMTRNKTEISDFSRLKETKKLEDQQPKVNQFNKRQDIDKNTVNIKEGSHPNIRSTATLISEIKQVILNLDNISGDLLKAKNSVSQLYNKNILDKSERERVV